MAVSAVIELSPASGTSDSISRFFRFRLLTLLLVVSVFCVWLGLQVNRAERQRRAVAWVRKIGGSVSYRQYAGGLVKIQGARTAIRLPAETSAVVMAGFRIPRARTDNPTVLDLEPLATDLIQVTGRKRGATVLHIWDKKERLHSVDVTVTAAPQEDRFADVYDLDLSGLSVADDDLVRLRAFPKLTHLNLSGTGITDRGLAHLAAFDGLQWLDVTDTLVTEAGLQRLQKQVPGCLLDESLDEWKAWRRATGRRYGTFFEARSQ